MIFPRLFFEALGTAKQNKLGVDICVTVNTHVFFLFQTVLYQCHL